MAPLIPSMPTSASARPMDSAATPLIAESDTTAEVAMKAKTASAKYSAGAEHGRQIGQRRGEEHHQDGGQDAAGEGADRGVANACGAAAALGHPVALEGGGDRRGVAGRVHQDRCRRVAEQPAEVDPGKHDERPDRVQAEGDRQQQGHRHRRPEAGQHADRGAEEAAENDPQQVHRRQHAAEALHQIAELIHDQSTPARNPAGRFRPSTAPKSIGSATTSPARPTGRTPVDASRARSRHPRTARQRR